MQTSHRTAVLLSLLVLAAAAPLASADDKPSSETYICPICHIANNQGAPYAEKAGAGLARGAVNTALGWTELVVQPTAEARTNGNLLLGLGKGVGYAITRTGAGLGELFTFWVPRGKDGYMSLTKDCPICMKASPSGGGAASSAPDAPKAPAR